MKYYTKWIVVLCQNVLCVCVCVCVWICDLSEFIISRTTTILFPGDTSAVVDAWLIQKPLYYYEKLIWWSTINDRDLTGQNATGTNITVSVPVKATFVIPQIPLIPLILLMAIQPSSIASERILNITIDATYTDFLARRF